MNPKLALLLWSYRSEILAVVAGLLMLVAMIGAAIASAFMSVVPLASEDHLQLYGQAVQELKTSRGLTLDYRLPLAVDAVQRQQDFSGVTLDTIRQTVARFVQTTTAPGGPCTDQNTDGKDDATGQTCTCTTAGDPPRATCRLPSTQHHQLRTLEEVLANLGFTAEQQEIVRAMTLAETESTACFAFTPTETAYTWPVRGVITSCYGYRADPVAGGAGMHYGIDVAASSGTPIQAAHDGTVTLASDAGNYGNLVILTVDGGYHTWYGHLDTLSVSAGQQISRGQILGTVGSTGKSTGPHLHFEFRRDNGSTPFDPLTLYR